MRDIYVIINPYGEIMAIRYLKQEEVDALAPVVVEDVVQVLETATNELVSVVDDINDNESSDEEEVEEEQIEAPEEHEEPESQEQPVVKPEPVKLQKVAFSGQHNNFKNNSKKGKR